MITHEGDNPESTGYIARFTFNDEPSFLPVELSKPRKVSVQDYLEIESEEGDRGWKPVKGECNGHEMRGTMCIIDESAQKFKMVDINESASETDDMS